MNIRSQQESQQQSPYGSVINNQSFVSNEQATFWGTNIIIEETEVKFLDFLKSFRGETGDMEVEEEVAVYLDKLRQIFET